MMRDCICGAHLDVTGMPKTDAMAAVAEWESEHWFWCDPTGADAWQPVGRLGHGPVAASPTPSGRCDLICAEGEI